ncbi:MULTISPECIES: nuclease-related domain-containing protein [unclassified Nocardioides]|uniref:nuclease-related domain-containing protein n=1 Tax=unclassified Nocardioides TaxID=2615069 RepID=UPI00138F3993|nr:MULTISPECIES: nuclease-related domain-containing protein [unclassified Nocardioides]
MSDLPGRWYLLGFLHAGLAAAALHLCNSAFLAHEGTAVWQLRGAWGEENTRSELQKAKRRRVIWGWVDSITLRDGDLDHVVVTRSGGIVVLDSKWRSAVDARSIAEMTASAKRAGARAQGLARTLLKSERGVKHRASAQPVTVVSVVVLWGAVRQTVPDGHEVDGVHFVDGRKLVPWLRQLGGPSVPSEAARDVLEQLKDYRATAFKAAQERAPGRR